MKGGRTKPGLVVAAALVASFGVGGCCSSCVGKIAGEKVPAAEAEKETKSYLEKARNAVSEMCGIPADGLRVTKAQFVENGLFPGTARVRVEGTPIVKADAGKIDPAKLLVCSGVVYVSLSADKKPDGTVSGWHVTSVTLDEVTTPGVKWEKPRGKH